MRTLSLSFLLFLSSSSVLGQPLENKMEIFETRRSAFMEKMQPGSVAIFPSKPVYLRNLDIEYVYRQESNFYYLSGFEEPEAVLFINPSAAKHKFVMFVRKRNRRRETYDGPRAGSEGAMATFRADTAYYIDDLETNLRHLIEHDRPVYYPFGLNPDTDQIIRQRLVEGRSRGNWAILDPTPILSQMRLLKNDGDWQMGFKKAIDISAAAFIEAIKSIEPGLYEYEIQAVFEYVYRKNGSPRNGYPCIVGSGPNSTILHYNKNTRQMQAGEVILMDCAAEYGYYSADITRSVPVSGKFTKEQRDIYDIVLQAQQAAIDMVKPGITKSALDERISDILGRGLVKLGFIRDKADYRIFSLHGYAHWLGLEVHDVGAYTKNGESVLLEPGMVFTIEPGLYVRPDVFDKMREKGYSEQKVASIRKKVEKYMHIGVRIEDDILVTDTGHVNLSQEVPREVHEIEELMAERGMIEPTSSP
ncbi:MAG: aminopeptidase P N-terminal domain-containing protein [bacterium]